VRVNYDNDDRLVEVRVYVDGRRVKRVRAFNVSRRVRIGRMPEHGTHLLKVFARLSDRRKVLLSRRYNGCTHGPTHLRVLRTPNAIKEP
jgi:hypothetical protein